MVNKGLKALLFGAGLYALTSLGSVGAQETQVERNNGGEIKKICLDHENFSNCYTFDNESITFKGGNIDVDFYNYPLKIKKVLKKKTKNLEYYNDFANKQRVIYNHSEENKGLAFPDWAKVGKASRAKRFNEETKRAWKRDYLYLRELKMLIQGEKITKIKVGGEIIYNNLIKNYDEAISAKKRLEAADKLSK